MNKINLNGLRVLNTRPLEQGLSLNQAILAANGQPIHCPALMITAPAQPWLPLLPDLQKVHQAIFISANAVHYTFNNLFEQNLLWPLTLKVNAIGKSTAKALLKYNIHADAVPEEADSEHLLELPSLQQVAGKTILLFKGEGGRPLIADTLKKRGANVIELDVYQRQLPTINQKQLEIWWREKAVDIILFTSQQAMENIITLFGIHTQSWLLQLPCLVISHRLAETASALGMQNIIIGSIDTIIETLYQFTQGMIHGQTK